MAKATYHYHTKYIPNVDVKCEVLCEIGKKSYKIMLKEYLPYNMGKPYEIRRAFRHNVTLLEPLNTQPDVNATDIEYEEEYEWQKYNNK
jgi:hypothetical protein